MTSTPARVPGDIKIAAIPLDITTDAPAENMLAATAAIERLDPDTDLAVLPELFTTGFVADKERLGELATHDPLPDLLAMAARHDTAIAGSYLATDAEGRYVNRAFLAAPGGETWFYDKHHLFCLSPEASLFAPGSSTIPVIPYRGWNIALAVCYDLRFPVWCRNSGQHYDALLIPANWPQARAYAWEHLLIARAIENQAVVVGANRAGTDPYGTYDALTYIFDGMGKPIGVTADGGTVYATLSLERLRKLRHALPVGRDADRFTLDT